MGELEKLREAWEQHKEHNCAKADALIAALEERIKEVERSHAELEGWYHEALIRSEQLFKARERAEWMLQTLKDEYVLLGEQPDEEVYAALAARYEKEHRP